MSAKSARTQDGPSETVVWALFLGLCLLGPVVAGWYWMEHRPRAVSLASTATSRVQTMQEAWNALAEYQRQYHRLPCPVPPGDEETVPSEEASGLEISLCDDNASLGSGVARGRLPWRQIGLVKDPELFYRMSQFSADPAQCRLAAFPAAIGGEEAISVPQPDRSDDEMPLLLPACAPATELESRALFWDAEHQQWQAPGMSEAEAAAALPFPPEEADGTHLVLSADGGWLAAPDAAPTAEGPSPRWLRWWRLSNDRERWLPIGRWAIPAGADVRLHLFAGAHLLAAIADEAGAKLADIPLWPTARAVAWPALPKHLVHASWQAMVALPEGRGVGVKGEKDAWDWIALEPRWRAAVTGSPATGTPAPDAGQAADSGVASAAAEAQGRNAYWPRLDAQEVQAWMTPAGDALWSRRADGQMRIWTLDAQRRWISQPFKIKGISPSDTARWFWDSAQETAWLASGAAPVKWSAYVFRNGAFRLRETRGIEADEKIAR